MAELTDIPGFEPIHPGALLREDVLPALAMSVGEFAKHLGVAEPNLDAVVAERASIDVDLAVRLGKALGNGPRFWLALQMQRDVWQAQSAPDIIVAPLNWKSNHAA